MDMRDMREPELVQLLAAPASLDASGLRESQHGKFLRIHGKLSAEDHD